MDNQQKLAALRMMQERLLEKFNDTSWNREPGPKEARAFASLILAEIKLIEHDPSLENQSAPNTRTASANRPFKPFGA